MICGSVIENPQALELQWNKSRSACQFFKASPARTFCRKILKAQIRKQEDYTDPPRGDGHVAQTVEIP